MRQLMNLPIILFLYLGSGLSRSSKERNFAGIILLFPYFFGRLTPYFDRLVFRSSTPAQSRVPRTMWYRTPGRSRTRPPRTSTIECSCRLWPSPGIYTVTSLPFDSRTRAILRIAELGFFGVMVFTCKHTPRRCGHLSNTGDLLNLRGA